MSSSRSGYLLGHRRRVRPLGALACVAALLAAHTVKSEIFSETWDAYTNNITPYGEWTLDKGSWGKIDNDGPDGGKCYLFDTSPATRISHKIDVSAAEDIVLQGWLYDSDDHASRSALGITESDGPLGKFDIRMGVGDPHIYKTYTIVFTDLLQSKDLIMINTKMPFEKGWHFMRLELLHDRTVNYRIWSADQTVEKTGTFGWIFDKTKFNFITLASIVASSGSVGWDDIKIGSLTEIGPPKHLSRSKPAPAKPKVKATGLQGGGLQLWLKFEDEGALSTVDSSGNDISADLRNGADIIRVDGHGRCLNLDGAEASLELPPGFADFSPGMTIAFWTRPTKDTSWGRLMDLGNGNARDNIILTREGDSSNLAFLIYQGEDAQSPPTQLIATNALELNKWQHLAVTMDEAGQVKFYKNGRVISEGACAIPNNVKRSSNFAGRSNVPGGSFYAGQFGDIRIYNRTLDSAEITKIIKEK